MDTSFWVAYQFRRDERHPTAQELWFAYAATLMTTNHVIGETWTFLRRRVGHAEAQAFVDGVAGSRRLVTVHVDEALEAESWQWLHRHNERSYSFVEATSFAVMRRERIREALAFDGDFTAAGFVEVRP